MRVWFRLGVAVIIGWGWSGVGIDTLPGLLAEGAGAGHSVVVVYNTRHPESKEVASYYASRRHVPANQVVGLDLSVTETISRKDFRERMQRPLRQTLAQLGSLSGEQADAGNVGTDAPSDQLRYLVLCYGVPVRIEADANYADPAAESVPAPLRRNEASVDSELAWLGGDGGPTSLTGVIPNPLYGATNMAAFGPESDVLMVARLDGPTAAVARGLVDQAILAEEQGMWGRAYVDTRGLTNSTYLLGDQWLRGTAELLVRAGFETVVDTNATTFSASFPLSQVGFYAGWYDGAVSGPFKEAAVEFMPGAFAYHLHSFSAATLRTSSKNWVGPLLARGAAASVGYVAEPYLSATLNVSVFAHRWIHGGFSYGEAVYAALPVLSWQTTVVGDPLYRPFGRMPRSLPLGARLQALHEKLSAEANPRLEWSHLQVINLSSLGSAGVPSNDLMAYAEAAATDLKSSVLAEKMADLFLRAGRADSAIEAYRRSLGWGGSNRQRIRVMLALANLEAASGQNAAALKTYELLLAEFQDYPDRLAVLRSALTLSRGLQLEQRSGELEKAIRTWNSRSR